METLDKPNPHGTTGVLNMGLFPDMGMITPRNGMNKAAQKFFLEVYAPPIIQKTAVRVRQFPLVAPSLSSSLSLSLSLSPSLSGTSGGLGSCDWAK